MQSNIFVLGPDQQLLELQRTAYESEDVLQQMIAAHPRLLHAVAGSSGRLLLISREHAVPDSQDASGRWSLDHLFLDGDSVPVLVEVKRATDTRARREVVAQMLDYAANGVAYWPIEKIIEAFQRTTATQDMDPDETLAAFIGSSDADSFWRSVEANLRSGRIRMVFLADEISKELRRIVEFLNEQMRPAEVLAVEIVHYASPGGVRTLVPQLVGATERAQSAKAVTATKERMENGPWLDSFEETYGRDGRAGAERVIDFLAGRGLVPVVSKAQDAINIIIPRPSGEKGYGLSVRRSTGNFEISLQNLQYVPAFAGEPARSSLLERVRREVPAFKLPAKLTGWMAIPSRLLLDDAIWLPLQTIITDIVDQVIAGGRSAE